MESNEALFLKRVKHLLHSGVECGANLCNFLVCCGWIHSISQKDCYQLPRWISTELSACVPDLGVGGGGTRMR